MGSQPVGHSHMAVGHKVTKSQRKPVSCVSLTKIWQKLLDTLGTKISLSNALWDFHEAKNFK